MVFPECNSNLQAPKNKLTDDGDVDGFTSLGEIESESDTEFSEDYGMMEEVPVNSEDSTINPIDCYRHFITDEIISLMVRETNRYANNAYKGRSLPNDRKLFNGNQVLMKKCSSFWALLLKWD